MIENVEIMPADFQMSNYQAKAMIIKYEEYINDGYEVKQMIPEVTPNGSGGFYKSGFTVYLEKEI